MWVSKSLYERVRGMLVEVMSQIHGDCDYCKYQGKPFEGPCKGCVYFAAKEFIEGDYWEWKGDEEHEQKP